MQREIDNTTVAGNESATLRSRRRAEIVGGFRAEDWKVECYEVESRALFIDVGIVAKRQRLREGLPMFGAPRARESRARSWQSKGCPFVW